MNGQVFILCSTIGFICQRRLRGDNLTNLGGPEMTLIAAEIVKIPINNIKIQR
jgi:hypothetical protein